MRFIETQIFTKQVQKLLKDDSYRMLQSALMLKPDLAPVIPGSGGLRKMRWSYQVQVREDPFVYSTSGIRLRTFT